MVFAEFGGRTVLATAGSGGVDFWDPVQRGRLLVFDPAPAENVIRTGRIGVLKLVGLRDVANCETY